MVGVGVGCTVCRRAMALYMRIGMVCYGVCGYGVQALGVRMVYVVYVSCGVRMVYVWCTYGVRCVYRSMTWQAYEGYDQSKPSTLNNQSTI